MANKVIFVALWLLFISSVLTEDGDIIMTDDDDEDIK